MIFWHIGHKGFRNYYEGPDGFVIGTAFLGDTMLQGEDLLNHVSLWLTVQEWEERLRELNGFFAILLRRRETIYMAVDRLRSIPLFYAQEGPNVFISDDARWIKEKLKDQEMDTLSKQEFLATGYVTGPDTLLHNLKQVQAGEFVISQETQDGIPLIKRHQYYRYFHHNFFEDDEDALHNMLENTLNGIFSRLISFARGRTIIVPLSGGYDSRLVVLMLKKLGHKDIIAFSYGKPGNNESTVSKFVADRLGIKWEFVPYSDNLWYDGYRSPEFKRFVCFADGLCSLPHIQDWPAVLALKKESRIPSNSVFVPGHSADLPAGSRSKRLPALYSGKNFEKDFLIDAILGFHYNLTPWRQEQKHLSETFSDRVLASFGRPIQYPDAASAFEAWDIAERQSKFIVNAVRVYEFFGYEWWIPFWDSMFMEYWSHIETKWRVNEFLYIKHVNNLTSSFGFNLPNSSARKSIRDFLVKLARSRLPQSYLNHLISMNQKISIKSDPFCFYGIESDSIDYLLSKKCFFNINSVFALDYVNNFPYF